MHDILDSKLTFVVVKGKYWEVTGYILYRLAANYLKKNHLPFELEYRTYFDVDDFIELYEENPFKIDVFAAHNHDVHGNTYTITNAGQKLTEIGDAIKILSFRPEGRTNEYIDSIKFQNESYFDFFVDYDFVTRSYSSEFHELLFMMISQKAKGLYHRNKLRDFVVY